MRFFVICASVLLSTSVFAGELAVEGKELNFEDLKGRYLVTSKYQPGRSYSVTFEADAGQMIPVHFVAESLDSRLECSGLARLDGSKLSSSRMDCDENEKSSAMKVVTLEIDFEGSDIAQTEFQAAVYSSLFVESIPMTFKRCSAP